MDQPEQEIAILPTKSAYLEDVKCLFRSLISSTAEEGTLKRTWAVFSEPKRISDPIGWFSTQYFRQPSGRAGLHVPTDDKPLLVQWLAYPTYKPVVSWFLFSMTNVFQSEMAFKFSFIEFRSKG